MPEVSVVIPSYNHEDYIEECINSVLKQSYQDFEIIITDDGSRDNTVKNILKFDDSRIKLYINRENKGACIAANHCIKQSSGKFIAMLSSDDVWMPDKLEIQVDFMKKHNNIAGVFTKIIGIDEDSHPIYDENFIFKDTFNVPNRTRYQWLNHFFYHGNCLCHPSSLIRRECYDQVGLFNPTMAGLPDLDFWVRLCFYKDIHIINKKLVKFRFFQNQLNASGHNPSNIRRIRFEYRKILDHYLNIDNKEDLLKIFPEASIYTNIENDDIPFILGQLAIKTNLDFFILWGLDILYEQLLSESIASHLSEKYGFNYLDFIFLTGEYNIHNLPVDNNIHLSLLKDVNYSPQNDNTERVTKIPSQKYFRLKSYRKLFIKKKMKLINNSKLFDRKWYLDNYPDVKEKNMDPARHYILYGGYEGRNPSKYFDSQWYLDQYNDVKLNGINPLLHFLIFGIYEGRKYINDSTENTLISGK